IVAQSMGYDELSKPTVRASFCQNLHWWWQPDGYCLLPCARASHVWPKRAFQPRRAPPCGTYCELPCSLQISGGKTYLCDFFATREMIIGSSAPMIPDRPIFPT